MIGENIDNKFGAKEEIAPVFEGANNCEEFTVPDGVVLFGLCEGGGIVSNGMTKAVIVTLVEDGSCHVLGGIYLDLEGLIVVGLVKNWISGCKGDQVVEGSSTSGHPNEGCVFLEEV